jgi:hypothetical protein
MGFFGRGVEVGTKEVMVAVGALRSCGSLGLAAAEALMFLFFVFFDQHWMKERKKEERKKEEEGKKKERKKKERKKKERNDGINRCQWNQQY